MTDSEIARLAARYLTEGDVPPTLRQLLSAVARSGVDAVSDAIPLEAEEDTKRQALAFFLTCIRDALTDHQLSDDEMMTLGRLRRLLRIREGDLLRWTSAETAEVLGRELTRMLEDRQVDPTEALQKVRLQELFGLSYDEFLELTAPVIDEVLVDLAAGIDPDSDGIVLEADLEWYHRSVVALDTAYGRVPRLDVPSEKAGYLYLLANASMPGLYKIGKTTRDPRLRTTELASATGVPTPFVLLFSLFTLDCHLAETVAHEMLRSKGYRLAENREFFVVDADVAISVIIGACMTATEEGKADP